MGMNVIQPVTILDGNQYLVQVRQIRQVRLHHLIMYITVHAAMRHSMRFLKMFHRNMELMLIF